MFGFTETHVIQSKNGRNLEETMRTRGNTFVLKCDEKDKFERVKCFVEFINERKRARGFFKIKHNSEILEKSVNEGVDHLRIIIYTSSSACTHL